MMMTIAFMMMLEMQVTKMSCMVDSEMKMVLKNRESPKTAAEKITLNQVKMQKAMEKSSGKILINMQKR